MNWNLSKVIKKSGNLKGFLILMIGHDSVITFLKVFCSGSYRADFILLKFIIPIEERIFSKFILVISFVNLVPSYNI